MTREEKAHSLGQMYFPDAQNIWARPNYEAQFVSEACVQMAEWARKRFVDIACEWLKNTLYIHTEINEDKDWGETNPINWVTSDYDTVEDFINDFIKAIEK